MCQTRDPESADLVGNETVSRVLSSLPFAFVPALFHRYLYFVVKKRNKACSYPLAKTVVLVHHSLYLKEHFQLFAHVQNSL